MTVFRTLLAIASLAFVLAVFYPVLATKENDARTSSFLTNEDNEENNSFFILSAQYKSDPRYKEIDTLFWNLFDSSNNNGTMENLKPKKIWQEELKQCQGNFVRIGVLKKLANWSVVESNFAINEIIEYIIEGGMGWPFENAIQIFKRKKNYHILKMCWNHNIWQINDNDSGFLKETFQEAAKNYEPNSKISKLCRKLLLNTVIIKGSEEAVVAFLAVDKVTHDFEKKAYLKELTAVPLSPQTKSNIMVELIRNDCSKFAVMLHKEHEWTYPPSVIPTPNSGVRQALHDAKDSIQEFFMT